MSSRCRADLSCRLITDDFPKYRRIGKQFEGGHEVVRHGEREYVRQGTDVHSDTIEGVFSLIRRGVMGTFHCVSRKHLQNYLNEFDWQMPSAGHQVVYSSLSQPPILH